MGETVSVRILIGVMLRPKTLRSTMLGGTPAVSKCSHRHDGHMS